MRIITIIIFLITNFTEASVIEVNYKLLNYKIDYNETYIQYTSSDVDLSLENKACNEHILKSFRIQMKKILKDDFLVKNSAETYSIKIDEVKKYDQLSSSRGQFLSSFHDYFSKLKIEESLSCRN